MGNKLGMQLILRILDVFHLFLTIISIHLFLTKSTKVIENNGKIKILLICNWPVKPHAEYYQSRSNKSIFRHLQFSIIAVYSQMKTIKKHK